MIGVYSERSHRIIPTTDCKIQNELAQEIAQNIVKFMNKNGIRKNLDITKRLNTIKSPANINKKINTN